MLHSTEWLPTGPPAAWYACVGVPQTRPPSPCRTHAKRACFEQTRRQQILLQLRGAFTADHSRGLELCDLVVALPELRKRQYCQSLQVNHALLQYCSKSSQGWARCSMHAIVCHRQLRNEHCGRGYIKAQRPSPGAHLGLEGRKLLLSSMPRRRCATALMRGMQM